LLRDDAIICCCTDDGICSIAVGVTTIGLTVLVLGSHVYVPIPALAVRETVVPGHTDAAEGVITKGTGVVEITDTVLVLMNYFHLLYQMRKRKNRWLLLHLYCGSCQISTKGLLH